MVLAVFVSFYFALDSLIPSDNSNTNFKFIFPQQGKKNDFFMKSLGMNANFNI